MNTRRVLWRLRKELDGILTAHHVLTVKKEPVLPMRYEDRTEWLLWCCLKRGCTMDEANQAYLYNITQMESLADRIKKRRRASSKEKDTPKLSV